jgi:tetratricopeptide (TPR) repeat protein
MALGPKAARGRGTGVNGRLRPQQSRSRRALRTVVVVLMVMVCGAGVVAFQLTRPEKARSSAAAFVPSPRFFLELSPAFRTAIADAYWLATVQYYGEHLESDRRFPALPAYLRLVTDLSPHFARAYLFGAFALLDAGEGLQAYNLLRKGVRRNPGNWQIPATAGMLVYTHGTGKTKDKVAAKWYERAAEVPGRPEYVPRIAAELLQKGGEAEKAAAMWAQVYATGDKYARDKAVVALDEILPTSPDARLAALEKLRLILAPDQFLQLVQLLAPGR